MKDFFKIIKLENGRDVISLQFFHEDYKKSCIEIRLLDNISTPVLTKMKQSVLVDEKEREKFFNALDGDCPIEFSTKDKEKIIELGNLLRKNTPCNCSEKVGLEEVLNNLYRIYQEDSAQGSENLYSKVYVREKTEESKTEEYLCVNYKYLKEFFEEADNGWERREFKKAVNIQYETWCSSTKGHEGEYMNSSEGPLWSIRVKMQRSDGKVNFIKRKETEVYEGDKNE